MPAPSASTSIYFKHPFALAASCETTSTSHVTRLSPDLDTHLLDDNGSPDERREVRKYNSIPLRWSCSHEMLAVQHSEAGFRETTRTNNDVDLARLSQDRG
jgi:hypothetical protein